MSFRDRLLDGRRLAVGGGDGAGVVEAMRSLGARVDELADAVVLDDDAAAAWVGERLPLQGLIFDARGAFDRGGREGLNAALRLAWLATRAVATGALIPGEHPAKVTLIAPAAEAGELADAARAGLENLARTLSVEWARFGVTTVAIWPGADTGDDELGQLVCYLHSPAGEYFSGCRFDLGSASEQTRNRLRAS